MRVHSTVLSERALRYSSLRHEAEDLTNYKLVDHNRSIQSATSNQVIDVTLGQIFEDHNLCKKPYFKATSWAP